MRRFLKGDEGVVTDVMYQTRKRWDLEGIYNCITTIESCIDHCCSLENALENASENVYKAAFRLARSIQLGQKMRH